MANAADAPDRTARLVHLALAGGPAVFALVVVALVATGSLPSAGNPTVHFAMVGVGLFLMLAGALLGVRIPSRRSAVPAADYWRATLPRAAMVWAVMEAGALLTVMAGLFSGTVFYTVIGVVAFLALMVAFNPARLSGG